MKKTLYSSAIASILMLGSAAAADYRLKLVDVGKRDYYCTITVELENLSEAPLADINGFFLSYVDQEEVGRSKGASFLNVEPGGTASAVFETPHAPCTSEATDVTSYRFMVGACRIGQSFIDRSDCASRIETAGPIAHAVAR